MNSAGRSCPLHYRYPPQVFARAADMHCDTLYVVGGLYGNEVALHRVLALFEQEPGHKRLLFNGDFNWFNTDPATFERVNRQVLAFDALRGNVETELASADASSGCGCGYPAWVEDAVVDHSNHIMQALRDTARGFPALLQTLAALPMHLRVDVAGLRVAVVHGDAESLAGWGLAQEHLQHPAQRQVVRGWFAAAQVDAFACSHTCLPVFHSLPGPAGTAVPVVLNNGAAGMPNFRAESCGLLTRISHHPFSGPQRRYGLVRGAAHIDALAIDIDMARWAPQFLRQWPPGSSAHTSYWQRICQGPDFTPAQALMTSFD